MLVFESNQKHLSASGGSVTADSKPQNSLIPQSYDVGRLTAVWVSGKSAKYSHDQLGRVDISSIVLGLRIALTDLVNITEATYRMWYWNGTSYIATTTPLTFNQSFDGAARPTQLSSNLVDSQHPATLLTVDPTSGITLDAKSHPRQRLTETAAYNNRFQPCRMNVNSTGGGYYSQCTDAAPSGNVLGFTYGFNAGTNNGNINFWSAAGNQTLSCTYTYDYLNRIATMADSASSRS